MRVALVDKGRYAKHSIKDKLKNEGFEIVKKNPEIVVSHGGDGTFFIAERKYPGIPKLLIRDSENGYLCLKENKNKILDSLNKKKYKLEACIKLKIRNLTGVNDVIIKSRNLTEALRFNLWINGKDYGNFIGDGLVIATPYGSTGYFHSITRKKFGKGKIGIAFNNTTKAVKPLIVKDNSKIEVGILRGIAEVGVDNNPKKIFVRKYGKLLVEKSDIIANVLRIPGIK